MLRFLALALACAPFISAADSEDFLRKSAPVTSSSRLVLRAEFGGIRIRTSAEKTVKAAVYFRGAPASESEFDAMLRDFTLDVTEQGSEVRVAGTFKDGWTTQIFNFSHRFCRGWNECLKYSSWLREIEYRVTVPETFSVDLETSGGAISVDDLKGSLTARTSGGALNFRHIGGTVNGRTSGGSINLAFGKGDANLRTSGGPIHIADVSGDVDASTSGGTITIEHTTGRVKANTSGGRIEVREASGAISAHTSGGAVSASLVGQPGTECRLSTSGGSINVSLGKDVHMDLDASTNGGRISTDFPVNSYNDRHQRELRAPLNGGGPLLYLHTSGGGIHVRRMG